MPHASHIRDPPDERRRRPAAHLREARWTRRSASPTGGGGFRKRVYAAEVGSDKDDMNDEFGAQGLTVLSVSIDDARAASKVKPYIKGRGYGFTVLLDKDTSVVSQYNPSKSLPYTVLIDRAGKINETSQGYQPGEEVHLREKGKKLVESGQ